MKSVQVQFFYLIALSLVASASALARGLPGSDPACKKKAFAVARALDKISSPESHVKPSGEARPFASTDTVLVWDISFRENSGATTVYTIGFENECDLKSVEVIND